MSAAWAKAEYATSGVPFRVVAARVASSRTFSALALPGKLALALV
jgi:hypothetical protein